MVRPPAAAVAGIDMVEVALLDCAAEEVALAELVFDMAGMESVYYSWYE